MAGKRGDFSRNRRSARKNPDITIVMDEIGYGVVPMSAEDREYRELVGHPQDGCWHVRRRRSTGWSAESEPGSNRRAER